MAVFRVERTGNYTVMSNHHLRDKRLSLKAKGLLSQMLSLPEDWDYTLAGLARINAEGRDAIRAAVVELERTGYVQRRQTTCRAGKFGANEYIIRERPVSCGAPPEGPLSAQPMPENPAAEEPPAASPAAEKPTQRKKDPVKTDKPNTDAVSTDSLPFPSAPAASPGVHGDPGAPAAAQPPEAKGRKRTRRGGMNKREMDAYRDLIRENIGYDGFVREQSWNQGQLDEMVELAVEAVCSQKDHIRVAGNDLPQTVVKSRLLKLEEEHIRFVFDCLRENTTRVRNMKQYLLAVLYNAPATMENHYAARVHHDFGGVPDGKTA